MNFEESREPPGHYTMKDSLACGAVVAAMLITMACGAFVVDAGSDSTPRYAHATQAETQND